jgi:Flp pilus assembly protein TadD
MENTTLKNRLSGPWPACILIILTAAIIYSNIYEAPFVFDDVDRIKNAAAIRDLQNLFSLDRLLKPRAVVDFTFALNYRFGKLDVFGYHLVNMVIHILNGVLVYFMALIIFRHFFFFPQSSETERPDSSSIPFMALSAALIFVAHPIQTQAVTYTVQRYASLAAFFYMASVLFYLKARLGEEGSNPKKTFKAGKSKVFVFYAMSAICGMAAFLSKETSASLPGIILLVEYLLVDRTWRGWKKRIPWFVLAFTLWALFLFIVILVPHDTAQISALFEDVSGFMKETEQATRSQYLCPQFNVIVIYIRLLFLPIQQNLDYLYTFKTGFFDGYTPLAFLFLVGLVALGIKAVKKHPVISLGIFWFFITLSVESSVIPIRDALFEHRLYLPMFGFSLIVTILLFSIFPVRRSWAIVFSFIIILALGTATFRRNKVWHDRITLWSDVVSKNPQNWRGHNNLGQALEKQDIDDKAIVHYLKALHIKSEFAEAHYNMGHIQEKRGMVDEAIERYVEALRIKPDLASAHYNLGVVLQQKGRIEEAIAHYSEALRIKPDHVRAHYNLALVFQEEGQVQKAIKHYLDVLQIDPEHIKTHNNLGVIFYQMGNTERAIDHFQEALRINPDYSDARNNLDHLFKFQ